MFSASSAVVIVILSVLGLALPGVILLTIAFPKRSFRWRWITGATLGLSLASYGSLLCSYVDIRLFTALWLLLLAACTTLWLRVPGRTRLIAAPSPVGWALLTLLSVAGILRVSTVAGRTVPKGWDPTFHMILTQKILLSHRIISDWQPFEAISVNYPLGSHALMASLSAATRLQPHVIFNILLPLIGVLLVGEVYLLAATASRKTGVGLFAAATYGFLAALGSIDYVRWGGLPNALGVLMLLAVLRLLLDRDLPRRQWLLAILIASLIVVHHHVMLVACALLGCLVVIGWARREGDLTRAILLSGVAGSVLALPQLAPYLLKAGKLGATAVMNFETQPSIARWISDIGWAFCILTVVGVVWYLRQRLGRSRGRIRIHWVVPASVLVLLTIFVLTGVIYPAVQVSRGRPPLGAFTPSRFITDAVPILAIYAGCAVYWAIRARWITLLSALVLCILGTISLLPVWQSMPDGDWPPGRCDAYRWISGNTPAHALVLTSDLWGPYFCWRKTLETPVPISEPQSFRKDELDVRYFLIGVLEGTATPPPDLIVLRVSEPGDPRGMRVIWQNPAGFAVERLWPR